MNRLLLPSTNPPTQGQARRKKSNTLAELHKKMINSNFATDRGLFCKHRKEKIVDVTVKKKLFSLLGTKRCYTGNEIPTVE